MCRQSGAGNTGSADNTGSAGNAGKTHDVMETITIRNLLLRGCILKNTTCVYGAVISAGRDTKVEFTTAKKQWWNLKVCVRDRREG